MSFWWLDPEFGLFLLFLLTMIWGILLTYAIMIKESIKWILLLQVIASIIYRIAWSRECIERRTISILSNDPPLIPYSVLVGITIFSWTVCVIGFIAEFFLLECKNRHGLSKRLCALSLWASMLQMAAYFWIFIIMTAPNSC